MTPAITIKPISQDETRVGRYTVRFDPAGDAALPWVVEEDSEAIEGFATEREALDDATERETEARQNDAEDARQAEAEAAELARQDAIYGLQEAIREALDAIGDRSDELAGGGDVEGLKRLLKAVRRK